jgi:hypothetical protein
VRDYLISQGNDAGKIITTGIGETVTVKLNDGLEPGRACYCTKLYTLGINEIPGKLSNYLFLLFN